MTIDTLNVNESLGFESEQDLPLYRCFESVQNVLLPPLNLILPETLNNNS